jgi:hypothetical protein
MSDLIKKLELSIENLKEKKCKLFFFVQDTKGNAKASVAYIYDLALTLKNAGFNSIILHEKSDYFGVQDWLGSEYMDKLEHISVEGQNLQVAPEDVILVPELFGYIMPQVANLPCGKVVICQSYDYIFETLQPGQSWNQFGFLKCITTSEKMKEYITRVMRNVSVDVIEPMISNEFSKSQFPPKPVIAIHTREHRDSINFIKLFYTKFPQYRWISFRDMRGISRNEFANVIKDCMLSVWVDKESSFGTFPIESMKSGVPVMGSIPNLAPEWMNEDNGIWVQDLISLPDLVADYLQNWLEDNVSDKLYLGGLQTAEKYSDGQKFEKTIVSTFNDLIEKRVENFESELNKQTQEENV